MLSSIYSEFLIYFSKNWASLLTWSLLVVVLLCIRFYQVKWVKAKNDFLESQRVVSISSNLSPLQCEEIKHLKSQCDTLEELMTATHQKLELNNQHVDKEVLELIYQIGSQAQGGVHNAD